MLSEVLLVDSQRSRISADHLVAGPFHNGAAALSLSCLFQDVCTANGVMQALSTHKHIQLNVDSAIVLQQQLLFMHTLVVQLSHHEYM